LRVQINSPISNTVSSPVGKPQSGSVSFKDLLQDALKEVNTLQNKADIAFEQLIDGEIEFHDAMIIAEKANLALQLTMAIRNKFIESYQEIMRMQV
jgi:flagellar hook-basal body complex protein FliE